jgi:hypothetical protein
MIAVFLCFLSVCTDLCDLDIVFSDTGSCMSRSLITIVVYSSETYYVFSALWFRWQIACADCQRCLFPANFTQRNEDVENGVRGSHLWRGLGGVIDMTDLIDNYLHRKWQPFAGGEYANS